MSTEHRAEVPRRLGCGVIINRREIGMAADAEPTWGRATFGISLFVVRRGETVVTCGSSTGYDHHDDNRYLGMTLKRIVGSHAANLQGQAERNRLFRLARCGTPKATRPGIRPLCSKELSDMTGRIIGILSTGSYLPKCEVLNDEVAERVGITAEWIERRTQIQARRYAAPHEVTSGLAVRVGVDPAHTRRTLRKYGNVGSASVPVALDAANRSGALSPGDLVLLAGSGGGTAIGASLLTWGAGV